MILIFRQKFTEICIRYAATLMHNTDMMKRTQLARNSQDCNSLRRSLETSSTVRTSAISTTFSRLLEPCKANNAPMHHILKPTQVIPAEFARKLSISQGGFPTPSESPVRKYAHDNMRLLRKFNETIVCYCTFLPGFVHELL